MALRKAHGTGADALLRIEVLPPDEQPAPVPGEPAPNRRNPDGTFADRATAKEMARRGGLARARNVRLVDSLGLAKIADDSTFKPYRDAADDFVRHHLAVLATQAGGVVGPGPSTMVGSAALQLAASRWAFDQASQTSSPAFFKLASQLADASRQNLLAAYELAVREGAARAATKGAPDILAKFDVEDDDK